MAFWWSLTASLYCDHVVALALGWCTARQHSLMILLITQLGEPFCLKNLLRNYKITSPASRVDPSIACNSSVSRKCVLSSLQMTGKLWKAVSEGCSCSGYEDVSVSLCLGLPDCWASSSTSHHLLLHNSLRSTGEFVPSLRSIYIKLVCSHLA